MSFLEKTFKLKEHNTTVSTEVYAGITTFMTMAYILAVNPSILSAAGMDGGAVFTATAISAVIATLCMAFFANLPFVLASGMGLNAYFAYTIAPQYGWQVALLAVFIEGIIFISLSFFNVREAIFDAIPKTLKHAVSVGIGLFICLIGLINSGVIVSDPATTVALGDIKSVTSVLTLLGLIITIVFSIKRIKGALLWGILITYTAGIICQATGLYVPDPAAGLYSLYPSDANGNFAIISMPPSIGEFNLISAVSSGNMSSIGFFDMAVVVFAFLFVDIFDTIGTVIGVSEKAGMLDKNGKLPKLKQVLLADAIGTTAGAMLGTSTVTTYVESAAGVADGGRTGLTSVVSAILFFMALIFFPIFGAIPSFATTPALVAVGLFMMASITKIDFDSLDEAFPAFICIVMMPFAYSISEGLIFGVLSYVILKVLTGKSKDVKPIMYVIAALFFIKLLL